METLVTFLFAALLTAFFVWRYLKKLAAKNSAVPAPAAPDGDSKAPADNTRPRPVINASLCIGCGSCLDACPEKGTLELVNHKAILAHPERCMGHGDCVTACPTSGIVLAFGDTLQTMRVPNVNEIFETNVSGMFIVGELGGLGLIKSAINEGKLAIDQVHGRLERDGLWTKDQTPADPDGGVYDVVIVGAGPGGLSATLTAHQYGLKYATLEQGEIASTIRNYPRHKFLMAEPLEMPLIGDLYIGDSTKEALLAVWEDVVAKTGVRIRTQRRVDSIARDEGFFLINAIAGKQREPYRARYVVLAIGKRGTPRKLNVPGEELSKVAYALIEAETYSDQDVLVAGGGDSAVEAALALAQHKRNRVTLSYRGAGFTRIKDRNKEKLNKAETEKMLSVLRNSAVREILPGSVRIAVDGALRDVQNQYVFVLIGGESPEEFLQKTGVEIVEKALTA